MRLDSSGTGGGKAWIEARLIGHWRWGRLGGKTRVIGHWRWGRLGSEARLIGHWRWDSLGVRLGSSRLYISAPPPHLFAQNIGA